MRFLVILIWILPALDCEGQWQKYPSKAEEKYFQERRYKFEPESISTIKSIVHSRIQIRHLDSQNKFKNAYELPPWLEYFDSLQQICFANLWKVIGTPEERHLDWPVDKFMKYYDSLEKHGQRPSERPEYKEAELRADKCRDSIERLIPHKKIAGIDMERVLRYDSLGDWRVLLFTDYPLTEFDSGYWIAVSRDQGKSWEKYFSGLIENNFYHVKRREKLRFFKNDSTVQLEVATVRRMNAPGYTLTAKDDYELVEDNLVLEIDLHNVMLDTDRDGLTDIFENRLLTNPTLPDTDADGIPDNLDSNPRFKSMETKYSNLFRFLLEGRMLHVDTLIPLKSLDHKIESMPNRPKTYRFVVTEDSDLMSVCATTGAYIFLTGKDLIHFKKRNQGLIPELRVSPLFKVDGKKRTWKIKIDNGSWGIDYLIVEQPDGWKVETISSWSS